MNANRVMAAVCGLVAATACSVSESSVPETPHHDPRPCNFYDINNWNNSGATVKLIKPSGCAVTYHDKNVYVQFVLQSTLPAGGEQPGFTPADNATVNDHYSGHWVASSNQQFMHVDSTGEWADQLSMTGQPALYPNPANSVQLVDSGYLAIVSTKYGSGTVSGYALIPGDTSSVPQQLRGPSALLTGTAGTWNMLTDWDTTSYKFAWQADGVGVAGGYQMTTSFGTSGTHTIRGIASRGDGTADTVTRSIKTFYTSISSPNAVQPMVTCSWSASASGGTAPYTYSWSAIGASGSGQYFDYTNDATSGSGFTLQLQTTDATGATVTIDKNVNVSSSAPTCQF